MVGLGGEGQGGCVRRIEVFVKIKKNRRGGGASDRGCVGGQSGCERRIKLFVKMQKKKKNGGGGGGCRESGWM